MTMYHVVSMKNCVWCDRAKALLQAQDLAFTEKVLETPEDKLEFKQRGYATVPQIFVRTDWVRIGGYEDLVEHLSK